MSCCCCCVLLLGEGALSPLSRRPLLHLSAVWLSIIVVGVVVVVVSVPSLKSRSRQKRGCGVEG